MSVFKLFLVNSHTTIMIIGSNNHVAFNAMWLTKSWHHCFDIWDEGAHAMSQLSASTYGQLLINLACLQGSTCQGCWHLGYCVVYGMGGLGPNMIVFLLETLLLLCLYGPIGYEFFLLHYMQGWVFEPAFFTIEKRSLAIRARGHWPVYKFSWPLHI